MEPPPPSARLDVLGEFFDLVLTEMLVYHRRFDDRRDDYRFSNRARLEHAEQRAMTAEEYVVGQVGRTEDTAAWCDWLTEHRIDAVVEPTIPIVAPVRGTRLRRAVRRRRRPVADLLLGLDGLPRRLAARPASARRSGLPMSVSLIGAPGRRLGRARVGNGAPGGTGYGLAVIDVASVTAIDVHVHTERTRAGHDPMPPELREAAARYFGSDHPLPTIDDVAAYYRERGLAAVVFTVDWELAQRDRADPERGDRRGRRRERRRADPVRERRPGPRGRRRARRVA